MISLTENQPSTSTNDKSWEISLSLSSNSWGTSPKKYFISFTFRTQRVNLSLHKKCQYVFVCSNLLLRIRLQEFFSLLFSIEKKLMTKKKGGKTKDSKGNKVEVNPDSLTLSSFSNITANNVQ